MDMIDKVVFQSQQRLALLPRTMRHIFHALCFVDKSSTSHCNLIQSIFGTPQSFLAQIYNVLFVLNPVITQLESSVFGFVGVLVGFVGSESVIWLLLIMINILCGPLKQLCFCVLGGRL